MSVQMQDYPVIEHVVIDGKSDDGTVEILKQHPHLIWISEPDRGQSHALNKGFLKAKGDIIGWLNADDTYQPGAISTVVQIFTEFKEIDLVYSDSQIIDANSQPIGISKSQPFELETYILSNYINQPTVFMRRHVIEELGGLNEGLNYVMDREFWLRVSLADFNIQYLPGPILANFRLCIGTKSFEQTPEFRAEWLKVLENAFQSPNSLILTDATKRKAIQYTKVQYQLQKMARAIDRRERLMMLHYLFQASILDWKTIFNRGTWLFVGRGLLGIKVDRYRKFQ